MFWENYVALCKSRGLSPSRAASEMGFSNAAPTVWKKGTLPSVESQQRIADYFGISREDLVMDKNAGIKKDAAAKGSDDYSNEDLLKAYMRADDSTKAVIRLLLKF